MRLYNPKNVIKRTKKRDRIYYNTPYVRARSGAARTPPAESNNAAVVGI